MRVSGRTAARWRAWAMALRFALVLPKEIADMCDRSCPDALCTAAMLIPLHNNKTTARVTVRTPTNERQRLGELCLITCSE